jgi:hypothetical protein
VTSELACLYAGIEGTEQSRGCAEIWLTAQRPYLGRTV